MIVKLPLVFALVTYINGVSSSHYSKVYVQNGPDYPVDLAEYGAPSVSYSPQVAQLAISPTGSVAPYSNYVPCGTPCVYPGQVVPVVAPTASIQYPPSPSMPVVVAPTRSKPNPTTYEYSYVVYDEQTGDHKAQTEQSDGSLVRGSYTFLQPDGYVREVQYVADDMQGFNAFVKNYLPVAANTNMQGKERKPEAVPCIEVKNDKVGEEQSKEKAEPSHENIEQSDVLAQVILQQVEQPALEQETNAKPLQDKTQDEVQKPKDVLIKQEKQPIAETPEKQEEISERPIQKPPVSIESFEGTKILIEPVYENRKGSELDIENSNVLVPYKDVIRCIESALRRGQDTTSPRSESPLTYIILNKPC